MTTLFARRHASPALARCFFTLPDLSALAPGLPTPPGGGSGKREDGAVTYHERKILPFTRRQLFNVVADMRSYPSFVPYCKATGVVSPPRPLNNDPATTVEESSMTVGFLSFTESYTSRVTAKRFESVEAVALSGTPLFKSLETTWRFTPAAAHSPHFTASGLPPRAPSSASSASASSDPRPPSPANDPDAGPTLVTLDLVYAFANPLHASLSSAFFGQVSKMMVEAFERRCADVYGPGRE